MTAWLQCGLIRPVLTVVISHIAAKSVSRVVRALGRPAFFFFFFLLFIRSIKGAESSSRWAGAQKNKTTLMLLKRWGNELELYAQQCKTTSKCRNHPYHFDNTYCMFHVKCGKKEVCKICCKNNIQNTNLLVGRQLINDLPDVKGQKTFIWRRKLDI